MSCPHCKLTLGWGPVQEIPEGVKWYKPVEPRLKCAHCGKYVKAVTNERLRLVCILFSVAAWYVFTYHSESEYFVPIMLGLLVLSGPALVGYMMSVKFEKQQ
jgi:hypothetical protein